MGTIILIIIGICVFMLSVYFTRWVFGIDQIIQNQKEQIKLFKNILENINKLSNSEVEKQNSSSKTISEDKKNNNIIEQYKSRHQN